jgi:hemolysin activation/secretion protein
MGSFQPTIPATSIYEHRLTLTLDRPTALTLGGFEFASRFTISGIRSSVDPPRPHDDLLRTSLILNLERPLGSSRLISHTLAAGVITNDAVPPQHLVYLGGPTTGPGYDFHEFVGRGGVTQRLELRFPAPFVPIPLGRYGKAPGTITLAPFANAVWIHNSAGFPATREGWYPSLGLGALTVFELLRIDVARGLRDGRWTFSVDIGRDFWSVL